MVFVAAHPFMLSSRCSGDGGDNLLTRRKSRSGRMPPRDDVSMAQRAEYQAVGIAMMEIISE
jgi:hypothetical protein